MRSLLVSGAFADIRTRGGKLIIRETDSNGSNVYELVPKNTEYESIVITRPEGNLTLQAIQWLSRNNIPLLMLNYRGELMSIMDMSLTNATTRIKQYEAYSNRRVDIARQFIMGKLKHTENFLTWLSNRYDIDMDLFSFPDAYWFAPLNAETKLSPIRGPNQFDTEMPYGSSHIFGDEYYFLNFRNSHPDSRSESKLLS